MPELDPNILLDISTKIATIDERTRAAEKNADHRHTNVMQAMQTFVPRKEIEQMDEATRAYAEGLARETRQHCDANREVVVARVSKLEDVLAKISENGVWLRRLMITTAVGATLSGAVYLAKLIFKITIV